VISANNHHALHHPQQLAELSMFAVGQLVFIAPAVISSRSKSGACGMRVRRIDVKKRVNGVLIFDQSEGIAVLDRNAF